MGDLLISRFTLKSETVGAFPSSGVKKVHP